MYFTARRTCFPKLLGEGPSLSQGFWAVISRQSVPAPGPQTMPVPGAPAVGPFAVGRECRLPRSPTASHRRTRPRGNVLQQRHNPTHECRDQNGIGKEWKRLR